MAVTWLHLSDFHLNDKGPYNQEVILRSLVESVRRFREIENRAPDLLFATGDIASKGNAKEYERATAFFDDLLDAAGLNRDRLFIVPGNHDVDRKKGKWSHRYLDNAEDADEYFDPDSTFPQLRDKFQAFSEWYNDYFKTIRSFPTNTTCSPVEMLTINGHRIAVLPLNSAIFCIDNHDHEKLFIGRRCLDAARKQLEAADLTIALIHHPLDWLSPIEQSNIEAKLEASVDLLLQGHYHQTSTKSIVSANGGYLKLAAGAAYQTGSWSKAAMYVTFDGSGVTIFPIRYEDRPKETWTLDTSLYPSPDYTERFEIPGKDASCQVGSSPSSACNTAMCDGSALRVKKSYERYGEALINLFSQFAPPEVGDYPDIEIPLAEVFVDLDISEQNGKVDDRDKGHDGKTKTLKQDALLQEIFHGNARTRVLLLIGDPGSGKTTLLQHYAMLCLEGSHGRLFPEADCVRVVFIELRNLIYDDRKRPVPLAEQIVGIYSALGLSADEVGLWWREMGKTESVLVLLDGLDEVTELEKRQAICRWIDDEGHAYCHRFFIVTTRRTGYVTSDGVVLQRKHREAILNDLDVGQQRDFLLKWFRAAAKFTKERGFTIHDNTSPEDKAKELYNYLYPEEEGSGEEKNSGEAGKKKKGLQEIACIPLLLKMMALLYQLRQFKPDSRIDLYKVVTDYLLHERDNARKIPYGIALEQSVRALALLAYTMHIEMRLDHSEGRMKEIMETRFQSLNTKVGLDTFFNFMVNRSGMLKPYGNAYRFWHKTFQEYLASREMVSYGKSDDFIRSIVQHYDDRKWEWDETLKFYFAQIKADVFDSFMEQLFDPEITTEVLQRKLQLMKTLIRESLECPTGSLCRKLKEPQLSLGVQWYVLDCLEVINKPAALDAVRDFYDRVKELSADDEVVRQRVLDKAVGIIEQLERTTGIERDLPPKEDKDPGHDNLSEQLPRIISNRYEYDAQYILIRKGVLYISYETEAQHAVECDLYVARYPVTNRQYRSFIDFLSGKPLMFDTALTLQSYKAALDALARSNDDALKGFKEYLEQERDHAELFRSRLDDNRKYNKEHQPVVGVSWYAARAYCLWLSMLDGKLPEYRLPTEIEWEWAAGGKREESEKDKVQKTRKYPWGDNPEPTEKHANYKGNVGATTDVGSYPDGATPEGLYDMAGNVWEWTNSWYEDDKDWRSLRGGSWNRSDDNLRCSARYYDLPVNWSYPVGFRVVRPSPSS